MDDPDPITLSALQHWAYCPRQCGLIHLEQAFDDNLHTLRGQAVHATVDQPGVEVRAGLRIERALPLWSDALGLIGKADVVEFEPDGTPYPVEYKHGSRHKAADHRGLRRRATRGRGLVRGSHDRPRRTRQTSVARTGCADGRGRARHARRRASAAVDRSRAQLHSLLKERSLPAGGAGPAAQR